MSQQPVAAGPGDAVTDGERPGRRGDGRDAPLRRGRRGGRRARAASRPSSRAGSSRDHGAVGLGQVDAHAHPRRPRPADRGLGRDRRHRDRPGSTTATLTLLRRDKVGFIFQFFNLLPMLTAEENIALPLRDRRAQARSRVAATRCSTPSASATAATHRPVRALRRPAAARRGRARAASRGPPSCSPTSPPATSTRRRAREILALLRRAVDEFGQTIVMVTHDPRAAAIADRVDVPRDGLISRDSRRARRPTRSSTR